MPLSSQNRKTNNNIKSALRSLGNKLAFLEKELKALIFLYKIYLFSKYMQSKMCIKKPPLKTLDNVFTELNF